MNGKIITTNWNSVISKLKALLKGFEKQASPRMQFRAIRHALSVAIACCEKQKPQKPIEEDDDIWNCPVCGTNVGVCEFKVDFCSKCGQAIDWKE